MEKPVVAAKQPAVLELEPGTYYWCASAGARRTNRFATDRTRARSSRRWSLR